MQKRRGFTLIEVIVALGILLIVILALLGNYFSYYSSVKNLTYRAIGQNLAEVMLEDVRSLEVGLLDKLVRNGSYPTNEVWDYYTFPPANDPYNIDDERYYVTISKEEWDDIPEFLPDGKTPNPKKVENAIHYPPDTNNDTSIYDSGYIIIDGKEVPKIESSYRIEGVDTVLGITSEDFENDFDSASETFINKLKDLPSNISVMPVYEYDDLTGISSYSFTVMLHKEVFPYYKRRIVITDLYPEISQPEMKIYRIEVTVSWTYGGKIDPNTGKITGGITKSVTVVGEKSYRQ